MNSKSFKQVQQNYDRLSGFYDLLSGKAEAEIFRRASDLLRSRKIERFLDIGCGTGKGLSKFKKTNPSTISMFGIDLSLKMCRITSKKNIGTANANGVALPFKSSVFDAVIYSFSLEIFPEEFIKPALDECLRVLKPGGVVCVICMADEPGKNLVHGLYLWANRTFPKIVDCRPISVLRLLNKSQFMIIEKEIRNLFGLPVEIVLAEKK
jgi:ubiquinone/menaquinone biosynthesis C-methylase UbiE